MMERTLLLVKPDGVERALIGRILTRLEDTGMKVVAIKMVRPDRKLAGTHYAADPKWFHETGSRSIAAAKERGVIIKQTPVQFATQIRNYLIESISSGPVVAVVLEGNEVISITRKLVGSTEPRKADPSTIRGTYSLDSYALAGERKRPILNLVHASEDKRTAEREIKVWFKPGELISYKRADEKALYG